MKHISLVLAFGFALFTIGGAALASEHGSEEKSKPTQHLKVADVTSMEQAQHIFIEKTDEIKTKTTLDVAELQQIHVTTYTLEKSVAYFAEHLTGADQALAQEIAVVVEDIHINSEDNKKEQTQALLQKYFALADRLIASF